MRLLPRELYQKLESLQTERGGCLDSIIQTEVDHPNSGCNVLVPDSQCYDLFSELLVPLTENLHGGGMYSVQTCVDPSALSCTATLKDAHFVACEISTRRNLREYPMPVACTRLERRVIYDILVHALTVSQADYRGHSTMLAGMPLDQQRELCSSIGQFGDHEAMSTVSSGLARDWPEARGEWRNTSGTITACINLQDHLYLKFTNREMKGGLHCAFRAFLEAIMELERSLQYHAITFAHHPNLGHLTASPAHLGAGLHITLQLRYALLTKCILFADIMRAVGFTGGQWEEGSDHFTVSYSHHFGQSEVDFFQAILNQAEELAVIECAYAKGDNLFPLLPASVQKGSGKPLVNFPTFPDKTLALASLLDQNKYLKFVTMKTPHGFALDDALQYGRDSPQDQFWFVLGDSHTLEVFSDIFLPVIRAKHGSSPCCPSSALEGCSPTLLHGARALCMPPSLGCYIVVRRNLSRFPFPSNSSHSSREAVNNAIHSAVRGFANSLNTGAQKIPLGDFQLNSAHPVSMSGALFPSAHAILSKDWPEGRSVWVCEELQLSLISNTTEHLTLVFHRQDGDILNVYEQFCCLYPHLEQAFDRLGYNFAKVPPYGFMSTRPHDFGLCTSAGVLLHAPALQGSSFVGFTREGLSAEVLGDTIALLSSALLSDATTHEVIQRAVNAALRIVELEEMAAVGGELPPEEDLTLVDYHLDFPNFCEGASLLAKHLSPLLYAQLIHRTTSSGFTLNDVIQVGVDQEGCGTLVGPGIVAGDPECYDVFRELYQPILLDLHSTCQMEGGRPQPNANPPLVGPTADPAHIGCITNTKAKLHCNLASFPFPPALSRSQRGEVEGILSEALMNLPGSYHPIAELSTHLHLELKNKGFLGSELAYPFFVSTCILRDWPQCRGLWLSSNSAVAAFVNGEDHLCLTAVSREGGVAQVCSALQQVFTALLNTLTSMGHQLARHDQFGLLTSSPVNAGSGFHLECTVKLPRLSAHALLPDIVASRCLRLVPESDNKEGLFTIVSRQSLGVTQQQIAGEVLTQVAHLHHIEAALEAGNCLYDTPHAPLRLANKLTMVVEDEFPDLSQAACPLALALDEELFWELYNSSTVLGATLEDVISVGLQNPDHPVGVVACDAGCYSVFSALYGKVLSNIYPGRTWQEHQRGGIPVPQLLLPQEVSERIVGFTVEYRRNLSGFSFPPRCTRAERAQVELILKDLLAKQSQLEVPYIPLNQLSADMEERAEVKTMTELPNPATGMTRDWPTNRGVCFADGGVVVGVNIDDHLKVCLFSSGSDLLANHQQVSRLMVDLESQLQQEGNNFAFSHQNGYLNTCPTHSGSGFKVEVKLHLPKLIRHPRQGRILQKHCFSLKSTSQAVNKVTGESVSVMELCYAPGHGVSERDTLMNLVSSLEHLCHTEASLHKKGMKWRAVPWTIV